MENDISTGEMIMEKEKSLNLGYFLALFLGGLGIHLFYVGKTVRGVFYLLFCWTYIPIILGWMDMLFMKRWIQEINFKNRYQDAPSIDYLNRKDNNLKDRDEDSGYTKNNLKSIYVKGPLFYNEVSNILPKYSHLKTPTRIQESYKEINQYFNNNTHVFYATDFVMDSYARSNTPGRYCRFEPLFVYWTTFNSMNQKQENWYLYWRSEFLRANFLETDLSYIILFTYELLNYSFNQNAAFNASILVKLFNVYRDTVTGVQRYLPQWISDFLLELGEEELAKEWGAYSKNYDYQKSRLHEQMIVHKDELDKISYSTWKPYVVGYRATEFFYANKTKIYKMFKSSIMVYEKLLRENGKSIFDEWFQEKKSVTQRELFRSAVVERPVTQITETKVVITEKEKIAIDLSVLFRLSENAVRDIMGEKRKIKVDESLLPEGMKEKLDEFIDSKSKASSKKTRFVKVREGSNSAGGSLIPQRPNKDDEFDAIKTPAFSLNMDEVNKERAANEEFAKIYRENYKDETEVVEENNENSDEQENETNGDGNDTVHFLDEIFASSNEDYVSFIENLDEKEKDILFIFDDLEKPMNEVNQAAKSLGGSANVIISEINEKSIEHLGDMLIEEDGENYVIVDEYKQVLNELKGMKTA